MIRFARPILIPFIYLALTLLTSPSFASHGYPNSSASTSTDQASTYLQGGSSSSNAINLDFEAIGNLRHVLDYYYAQYNLNFSADAIAVVAQYAGGNGNFAGEPTKVTAMTFTTGAAYLNIPDGMQDGFSFYYASIRQAAVVDVYSELDLGGVVLATLQLPATPSLTDSYAECVSARATGVAGATTDFCPFYPVGVNFTGTAYSIDFGGAANEVLFDDITLGSYIPGNTRAPTRSPSTRPSRLPTTTPSTVVPTQTATAKPSSFPSTLPPTTSKPSRAPTTLYPSAPSASPTRPTSKPTTAKPSRLPSTATPSVASAPSSKPSKQPVTGRPTSPPSTRSPTINPSTRSPSAAVTEAPSSAAPTLTPSLTPSANPSNLPSSLPSRLPTTIPSMVPSRPTFAPTSSPSRPTCTPSYKPTRQPNNAVVVSFPPSTRPFTGLPTSNPTQTFKIDCDKPLPACPLTGSGSACSVLYMEVRQVVHGIGIATVYQDPFTFTCAVANLTGLNWQSIVIGSVAGTSSSRESLASVSTAMSVSYSVSFEVEALSYASPLAAYSAVNRSLTTAVLSGDFTRLMNAMSHVPIYSSAYAAPAYSDSIYVTPFGVTRQPSSSSPTSVSQVLLNANAGASDDPDTGTFFVFYIVLTVGLLVFCASIMYVVDWAQLLGAVKRRFATEKELYSYSDGVIPEDEDDAIHWLGSETIGKAKVSNIRQQVVVDNGSSAYSHSIDAEDLDDPEQDDFLHDVYG